MSARSLQSRRHAVPGRLHACALAAALLIVLAEPAWAQSAPPAGDAAVLGEVTVTEQSAPSVYNEARDSYVPKAVEVGKVAQTLREIPQSVTVVTRQRMDDQALRTLDDVMQQTTGVTREETWLDTAYLSRGLQITNIRYDGGAAGSTRSGSRSLDMAQFDSVSLLRGADGLFGAGEAGGVINFTYKRVGPAADAGADVGRHAQQLPCRNRWHRGPECRGQFAWAFCGGPP